MQSETTVRLCLAMANGLTVKLGITLLKRPQQNSNPNESTYQYQANKSDLFLHR